MDTPSTVDNCSAVTPPDEESEYAFRNNRHMTRFGKRRGGQNGAWMWMSLIKGVAVIGLFGLAFWLGDSSFGITVKSMIIIAWAVLVVVADLAILFLYVRFMRALTILGVLTVLLVICMTAYGPMRDAIFAAVAQLG